VLQHVGWPAAAQGWPMRPELNGLGMQVGTVLSKTRVVSMQLPVCTHPSTCTCRGGCMCTHLGQP
jgi:hypothetical protein